MSEKTPERNALEAKAEELGLKVPANMKDATLEAKIAEAEAAKVNAGASPPAKDQKPSKAGKSAKSIDVLEVVGPKTRFRRAGFSFGAVPVVIPLNEISKAKAEAIMSEPKLAVVEKTIKVEPE